MSEDRWVVVVFGAQCDEYPGTRCVMDVLGPYSKADARKVAGRWPEWTAPHLMLIHQDPAAEAGPGMREEP